MPIHSTASTGFEAAADTYARGRPDYPAGIDAWLRETLRLDLGRTVLDLGAGTGKFTRRLIETGARVLAVEPVAAMRARLATDLPELEALEGTAEAIPLPDASVDAVVCAQSFHWFATADALTEIARVLRPGGRLGLVWNSRDDAVWWVREVMAVIGRYEGETPRFHSGEWRSAFPHPAFGPLQENRFHHEQVGPVQQVVVDRMLSVSFIANLAAEEQSRVADELRAIVSSDPQLAGKAEIAFPYVTYAFAAERIAA